MAETIKKILEAQAQAEAKRMESETGGEMMEAGGDEMMMEAAEE